MFKLKIDDSVKNKLSTNHDLVCALRLEKNAFALILGFVNEHGPYYFRLDSIDIDTQKESKISQIFKDFHNVSLNHQGHGPEMENQNIYTYSFQISIQNMEMTGMEEADLAKISDLPMVSIPDTDDPMKFPENKMFCEWKDMK